MRLIADSNGIDSYSLLTLRGVGKMRPVRLVRLGASVSSNMTIGQTSALMSRAFSLLLTVRDLQIGTTVARPVFVLRLPVST